MAKMAILVDGGFYRVRIRATNGRTAQTPQDMATELVEYCTRHATASKQESGRELYRTFYYDCPPVQASVRNPIDLLRVVGIVVGGGDGLRTAFVGMDGVGGAAGGVGRV